MGFSSNTAFQRNAFQFTPLGFQIAQPAGGAIGPGGTFSRGRWRKLQDELREKIEAQRALEAAAKAKEEALEAAELQAAEEQRQRLLAFDQLMEEVQSRAALDARQQEYADRVGRARQELHQHMMHAHFATQAAAHAHRLQQEEDEDEERAIALLLEH
jgi:hypothetical protein